MRQKTREQKSHIGDTASIITILILVFIFMIIILCKNKD